MPELSICMPSNRNLEQSRASIDSAIAYCEARDAVLIVSDNSGDPAKRAPGFALTVLPTGALLLAALAWAITR